jgi:hypothetical protein
VSRQVGAVEATDNPIAEPKAISTSDRAAPVMAPAITADQFRKMAPVSTGTVAARSEVSTAGFLFVRASAQAQERQNEQDHDDKTD